MLNTCKRYYKRGIFSKTSKKQRTKKRCRRMSRGYALAMKGPWKVTYRNKNFERTTAILKDGIEKDTLLNQLHKYGLYIYGINNLTDYQIKYYERVGLL